MAQSDRRRRTPSVVATRAPSPGDPPGASSGAPREPSPAPDEVEQHGWVTCFLSGDRVPKEQAVLVRIGPGRTMWMAKNLTSQG